MKFYLGFSLASSYLSVLDNLVASFPEDEKIEKSHTLIPFVLTCAAALECLLNDTIIEFTTQAFGHEEYRKFADALMNISLRGKLDYVVPLVSNYEFLIRQESDTYQVLASLISIRNKLTHNKSYPYGIETEKPETILSMQVPKALLEQLEPNITISYCKSILNALRGLANVFNSNRRLINTEHWSENEILVQNKARVS